MNPYLKTALLVFIFGLADAGCNNREVVVRQYGEMRKVLHDGQMQPRIDLLEVTRVPHAYGVGAIENLNGEITIADGDVWVARASDDALSMNGPEVNASDRATLLTLSYVPHWKRIKLSEPLSGSNIETVVEEFARSQGINTNRPFPFIIEGSITRLESHVIAGSCPLSNAAGNSEPWRLSLDQPVRATLVGFFASHMDGIMMHRGSSVHVHAIVPRQKRMITVHVDQVVVAAGSVLQLPE